jgi:hypothetical protein
MITLPAREKFDIAEKVAQYLVLAGTLDKNAPLEDYDRANELSLELAMLLPASIYRSMVEAATHPNAKVNAPSVAIMMRTELLGGDKGDLEPIQIAVHGPGPGPERPKSKTH